MRKDNIVLDNKTVLITGAAGFIGANLVMNLLTKYKTIKIIGLDNMSDYYSVDLKNYRLQQIKNILNIFIYYRK